MMEILCGDRPVVRQRFNRVLFGSWVLVETFYPSRSAASATALQWWRQRGIWLTRPDDRRDRGAWRWLCLRLRRSGPIHAIRWTLPNA